VDSTEFQAPCKLEGRRNGIKKKGQGKGKDGQKLRLRSEGICRKKMNSKREKGQDA